MPLGVISMIYFGILMILEKKNAKMEKLENRAPFAVAKGTFVAT